MSKSNGTLFGDKHTYTDWGLIASSRAYISPAIPKYNFKEVPGSDEIIDDTESLDGLIRFYTRKYSQDFLILSKRANWFDIYSKIQNYLNGKKMKMVLDEDPLYYYEGRFHVNEWKSDKSFSIISIEGTIYPYKLKISNDQSTQEDWLWDPFDFENGIIVDRNDAYDIEVDGYMEITIHGSRMQDCPVIWSSADMTVTFEGETYNLVYGENIIPEIQITEGDHVLAFTGTGTVNVNYKIGSL